MKKKLIGFSLKPIFRLLVAVGVIAFAASITAVSCGKPDAGGGNNNNNNNLGPVDPIIKITANQKAVSDNLFKIEANGDMKVNATKLAADTAPYGASAVRDESATRVTNAVRLIDEKNANLPALFDIELMRNSTNAAEGGIVLVVGNKTGAETNTNNIDLKSVADSHADAFSVTARQLNIWKRSVPTAGANFFQLVSYRAFSSTSPNAAADGRLTCATEKLEKVHDGATATDATKLPFAKATCYFGVFTTDTTSAITEINDRWVDDGGTVKDDDLRVMGIYTGDTGLGSLSGATGWDKSSFFGAQDNAAVKAIIAKNKYVEKTFKITLVKSSGF